MTGYAQKCRDAKQFERIIRFLERHPNAPAHEAVSAVVGMAPDLTFEYFQIAFSDWSQFRLESQAEIDSMIQLAMKARAA